MQESNYEISKDPYFINFIGSKNLSKSTEIVYLGRIKSFCEFLDKNPSELIKEAQKESGKKINEYFYDYIENLKKSGKSPSTIINQTDTVKSFYNNFDIDTNGIKPIIFPETNNSDYKIISSDQIREALELSCLRDKAIILLHLSSGMEATELRSLTYGDFINSIEEYIDLKPEEFLNVKKIADTVLKIDDLVGTWKIEKHRTKKDYVTFNTPESTKAILNYLIDRERKNKPFKSVKDPLFVNSQNQSLKKSAHGSIFKRINNRANFGYLTKKRRFFSSTMLRKFFKDKLYELGVDETTIDAFLGQKLDNNIDYHSNDQISILKKKYSEFLGELSMENVNIKTESITSKEYKLLIAKLNEKDKELEEIKEYLKHIKQGMNLEDV
ncbi:MAG: site-specific recombinase XerD [Methanobacterium sp. Maddingley MBC34]|nr:MAG: site-specific recombinase XerD [Methanobacterium sp. Maddingley MBC34]